MESDRQIRKYVATSYDNSRSLREVHISLTSLHKTRTNQCTTRGEREGGAGRGIRERCFGPFTPICHLTPILRPLFEKPHIKPPSGKDRHTPCAHGEEGAGHDLVDEQLHDGRRRGQKKKVLCGVWCWVVGGGVCDGCGLPSRCSAQRARSCRLPPSEQISAYMTDNRFEIQQSRSSCGFIETVS